VALVLVQTLPLAWRRRRPLAVSLVTGLATATYGFAPWPDLAMPIPVGGLVGMYSVAAWGGRPGGPGRRRHRGRGGGALPEPAPDRRRPGRRRLRLARPGRSLAAGRPGPGAAGPGRRGPGAGGAAGTGAEGRGPPGGGLRAGPDRPRAARRGRPPRQR